MKNAIKSEDELESFLRNLTNEISAKQINNLIESMQKLIKTLISNQMKSTKY